MNIRDTLLAVSMTTAGVLAVGCAHNDDNTMASSPDRHTSPTQPSGVTSQQATNMGGTVDRLTAARCDREQACNNIGDGKKYASRSVCMEQIHGSIANDLNSYQCPGGLDDSAVNQCMNAIGNEECGVHPMEALSRLDKCRSGSMCPSTAGR
jgi:hypothetical protein